MRLQLSILALSVTCSTLCSGQDTRSKGIHLSDAPSAIFRSPAEKQLLANQKYRPLTKNEKWHEFLNRTYAPSTFMSAAVNTTYSNVTSSMRYCCGMAGWGKDFGASVADTEARNFFGKFLYPTLLKQDPRYLPKREGGFWGRAWYAATRVLVTRRDDGRNVFNTSEFLAIASSKALTNAYYPDRDRTWGRTANSVLGALQGDASGYLLTEFAPDLKRIFRRHTPKRLLAIGDRIGASKTVPHP